MSNILYRLYAKHIIGSYLKRSFSFLSSSKASALFGILSGNKGLPCVNSIIPTYLYWQWPAGNYRAAAFLFWSPFYGFAPAFDAIRR
jgi:hypothetical protein